MKVHQFIKCNHSITYFTAFLNRLNDNCQTQGPRAYTIRFYLFFCRSKTMSIDIEITKTKSKVCRNYIGPSFIVSSLLSSLLTVIEMKARHSGSIRNSKSARLIFANFDDKEIQYIIHFKCGILSFFPPLIGCQGHSMQNVALKRSVGSGVCVCVPIRCLRPYQPPRNW